MMFNNMNALSPGAMGGSTAPGVMPTIAGTPGAQTFGGVGGQAPGVMPMMGGATAAGGPTLNGPNTQFPLNPGNPMPGQQIGHSHFMDMFNQLPPDQQAQLRSMAMDPSQRSGLFNTIMQDRAGYKSAFGDWQGQHPGPGVGPDAVQAWRQQRPNPMSFFANTLSPVAVQAMNGGGNPALPPGTPMPMPPQMGGQMPPVAGVGTSMGVQGMTPATSPFGLPGQF